MKKIYWLLFFAFLPIVLSAQYERILKNRHVIWAAEIEMLYNLNPFNDADSIQQNDIIYWKNYDPKNQIPYEGGERLIKKIIDAAFSGKRPAWELGKNGHQLSLDEAAHFMRDTIVVFDPETATEMIKVVKNDWDPHLFSTIRAKQLLYFDEKTGDFGLLTSAIAPVIRSVQGPAEARLYNEFLPFWVKLPITQKSKASKPRKVNNKHITWAAQIKTLGSSPELEKQHILKNSKPPVMQVLLDRFKTDRQYKVKNALDEPIPFADRKALITSIDTVRSFNPETYEVKTTIVDNSITADHLLCLRLVENWYWDEQKQQLIIELDRYAPLIAKFNPYGDFLFDRPLFYR